LPISLVTDDPRAIPIYGEVSGLINSKVMMCGGEAKDGLYPCQRSSNRHWVTNIALDECRQGLVDVGFHQVETDNLMTIAHEPLAELVADESGSSGDANFHSESISETAFPTSKSPNTPPHPAPLAG
jgi:hypothetical protein